MTSAASKRNTRYPSPRSSASLRASARGRDSWHAPSTHHEAHGRCAEINDVAPRKRHLPPKLHAQLARTERRPEAQLGRRHHAPIRPSALLKPKLFANEIVCLPITQEASSNRMDNAVHARRRAWSRYQACRGMAAQLGPMPTQEASVNTRTAQCTHAKHAWSRASASYAHSA